MHSVLFVHQIDEVELKEEQKTFPKHMTDNHVYWISDAMSSHAAVANAVALNIDSEAFGVIRSLDGKTEATIIKEYAQALQTYHVQKKQRVVIVIDLTELPHITVGVDIRDQKKVMEGADDKFARDVVHTWQTYDMTKRVPVIYVNMKSHSTGLKLMNWHPPVNDK